jgi:hypothetical protein
MVCTWRPLVEKFSILLWQARVGREIEICERKGRGNEKAAWGMTRAPSVILHHWWLGEAL